MIRLGMALIGLGLIAIGVTLLYGVYVAWVTSRS